MIDKKLFASLRMSGAITWEDAKVIHNVMTEYAEHKVIELGAFTGLSTLVILEAIKGKDVEFISVDIMAPGALHGGHKDKGRSCLVPKDAPVTLVTADALAYVKALPENSIDVIFEDTNHQTEFTSKLIPFIMKALKPGGVAIFHDLQLIPMQKAFEVIGMDKDVIRFPPSWMGLLRKEK